MDFFSLIWAPLCDLPYFHHSDFIPLGSDPQPKTKCRLAWKCV